MVDDDDRFEPARKMYTQNIIYVFKDGVTWLDTNKAYWPRYAYDLKLKINKRLQEGLTVNDKFYRPQDIESVTIVYPQE